jgi:hypothetical protein
MPTRILSDFEAFHRLVPALVERINAEPALGARAMANPLLALEELGVHLTPELEREVERRLRFSPAQRERLASLDSQLKDAAGERLDAESPQDLERVLFARLKLPRPEGLRALGLPEPTGTPDRLRGTRPVKKATQGKAFSGPETGSKVASPTVDQQDWEDPLTSLRGQHPVVDLALEYRAICRGGPAFASRAAYTALKEKGATCGVLSMVVRLPEHEEAPHA